MARDKQFFVDLIFLLEMMDFHTAIAYPRATVGSSRENLLFNRPSSPRRSEQFISSFCGAPRLFKKADIWEVGRNPQYWVTPQSLKHQFHEQTQASLVAQSSSASSLHSSAANTRSLRILPRHSWIGYEQHGTSSWILIVRCAKSQAESQNSIFSI